MQILRKEKKKLPSSSDDHDLEVNEISETYGYIALSANTPLGYIGMDWHPTMDELCQIAQILVKKVNKAKTIVEAFP